MGWPGDIFAYLRKLVGLSADEPRFVTPRHPINAGLIPQLPVASPMPEAMKQTNVYAPNLYTPIKGTSTSINVNEINGTGEVTVSGTGGLPADFPYANSDRRSPEEARRQLEKRVRAAQKRKRTKKIAKASKKRNRK